MRLDLYLVEQGLVPSRQRAKEAIAEGSVYVNGLAVTKASYTITPAMDVEYKGEGLAYPSRAGLKLEKALAVFRMDPAGLICLDVGASTGGFTSCLLQHGAKQVFALDVGHNQLVPALREDKRVVVYEKINIRDVAPEDFPSLVDLVVIDVSFVSLEKVFPAVRPLLKPAGQIIALVKPQFETGGVGLSKQGVITQPRIHREFLPPLINKLQGEDLGLVGFDGSPITGNNGNIEFLAHFVRGMDPINATPLVEAVIHASWK